MFIAAMHNGISRLYETFGNGGADTEERSLRPNDYARTWFRQNPPLPKAKWSQRNNNNYEQTGVLTALNYFASNGKLFLRNFLRESKAVHREAAHRGSRRVRVHRRGLAPGRPGRPAQHAPGPEVRDPSRDGGVHRPGARQASASHSRRKADPGAAQARAAHVPGGFVRAPHGPALQPHRRHAARLSILVAQRSAEEHLR